MDIFEAPEDLGLYQSLLHERHLELLHTYECLPKQPFSTCRLCSWGQRCQEMEPVVRHMKACRSYSECSFPSNCWILRAKMKVWSDCTDENCPVCSDLKGWRLSMTTERRKLLIGLLQDAGDKVPKDDPSFGTNRKYTSTRYERAVYNEAESVTDYFRHLATKKWDMELNKIRCRRNPNLFISRYRV